eukprot:416201_1
MAVDAYEQTTASADLNGQINNAKQDAIVCLHICIVIQNTRIRSEPDLSARNKRSRQCDRVCYDEAGRDYLESICTEKEVKSKIDYYYGIGYDELKDMFKLENISREAEKGGFYFIYKAEYVSYSRQTKALTIKYCVKWGELVEDEDDDVTVNQYAVR